MRKDFLPVARNADLVDQKLADETLVYDFISDKALCLNETCALVWRECTGQNTVPDISRNLSLKLKSPVTEELVYLALSILDGENLMVRDEQFARTISGTSRREMIKRVGTATAVAIPLISSLIAPVTADAASSSCQRTQYQMCELGSTISTECCQPPLQCTQLYGLNRCL